MGCRVKTPELGDTRFDPPTAPPHLPCFLFTPALFCFANGFFIYFGGCRELQGKKRRNYENPVAAEDDTSTDPASPLPRAACPPYLCLLRRGLCGVLLFELWYRFIAVRLCSGP